MTTETLQSYLAAAKAAKERADKATPGPLYIYDWGDCLTYVSTVTREPAKQRNLGRNAYVGHEIVASYRGPKAMADAECDAAARTDIPQLADAVVELVAEVEQARKAERDEIIAKGVAWLADFREQDDDDDIVTYPEGAEMLADFIEALGGHVYG